MRAFARRSLAEPDLRQAAVAVTVVPNRKGTACFLLTRRADSLRRNAGQWALPGGRLDTGEEPADAAVRELGEELGLAAGDLQVVGLLDDFPTRSGYRITPVVLFAKAVARLRPNPLEVAAAYRVPLAVLDQPLLGPGPLVRFRIKGRIINPPTAAVLFQFVEVAVHGREQRVAHFEQPAFTWT